jgi:hypothetical protein
LTSVTLEPLGLIVWGEVPADTGTTSTSAKINNTAKTRLYRFKPIIAKPRSLLNSNPG